MRALLYRWRLRRWNRAWKRRAALHDPEPQRACTGGRDCDEIGGICTVDGCPFREVL